MNQKTPARLRKTNLTQADGANQIGGEPLEESARVIPGTNTVQSPAEEPNDEDEEMTNNPIKKARAERDALTAQIKKRLADGPTPVVKAAPSAPVADALELVNRITKAQAEARRPRRPEAQR